MLTDKKLDLINSAFTKLLRVRLIAGNKKGVIYYKKIESLFGHDSLTMQELLPDLLKQLSDPETRPGILPLMERALNFIIQYNGVGRQM